MFTLANDLREAIPIVAIGGGLTVAVFGIVFGTIKQTVRDRAREETRREIAAYVAEGSISPDDAQRLLAAGASPMGKAARGCC